MDIVPLGRKVAIVLILAGLAAPAAAGEPFHLDPATSYTSNPAVTALPEGGFLVAWNRNRRIPLSFGPDAFVAEQVAWRRLSPSGAFRGPAFVGANDATGSPWSPQIAADGSGGEVVWHRQNDFSFLIEGRGVDPSTRTTTLAACAGSLRGSRLLPASPGAWLIWSESCRGLRILGQRLDPDGRPTATARVLLGAKALPGSAFDFTSVPGRGLVGAWVQRLPASAAGDRTLVVRAFRPDGRPRGATIAVGDPSSEIAVLGLPNGDIWLAWRANGPLVVQGFRASGEPLGPAEPAGTSDDVSERAPRWSNLENGRAVLVWQRFRDVFGDGCMARTWGPKGFKGAEVEIAERCSNPSVALLNGRALVVFQERGTNPEDGAVFQAMGSVLSPSDF